MTRPFAVVDQVVALDARLYLPEVWMDDRERMAKAGFRRPRRQKFQTPSQAVDNADSYRLMAESITVHQLPSFSKAFLI